MASRYQCASNVLDLPSAQKGNEIVLSLRTTIHKSMSGEFWAYKATPVKQTLRLSYAKLNRPTIMKVRSFLIASAGKEVWYTDHANRLWKGYIRTGANEFTHNAIRDNTFTLEMEIL